MVTQTEALKGYKIIRFMQDIGSNADISDILDTIKKEMESGKKRIALSFTKNSYLSSRSISVLIQCSEMIVEAGGDFAVISPNPDMLEVLAEMGLECKVKVYKSEDLIGL